MNTAVHVFTGSFVDRDAAVSSLDVQWLLARGA